jgi:hypothetical protein
MLVGGPIGIALIAVAALPAVMIGLPVWVGTKVCAIHSNKSHLIC